MDETSRQQVRESRASRPVQPGAPAIYDYEYERCGVSNLFMLFAPLEGWRRRTPITPPATAPINSLTVSMPCHATVRVSDGVVAGAVAGLAGEQKFAGCLPPAQGVERGADELGDFAES